ncbi:TetR/AcrR family transcriptional regulator [Fodinicola acaciae]|uniref:TetR/AcrR family transcriptional regulator n=1 Tax=Fodinicola acaciae TaxID=2681555 RepID=UPI0013D0F9A9|nr:TetR/AcrR family transcriptional regulator [Fodinicola acaciae]
MDATHVVTQSRGGLADKRRAILAGALTVFARDGYSRASVDGIAAEAKVSTRTIYNHFHCKAHLFEVVIQESAVRVARAQIALIDSYLRKVTDLEEDLIEFGRALQADKRGHDEHFALVRQVNAELGHIPEKAYEAWQESGPRAVRRALAGHLRTLVDRGLLRADDTDLAAFHLMLLITGPLPSPQAPVVQPSAEEVAAVVTAGVRAFLGGYAT